MEGQIIQIAEKIMIVIGGATLIFRGLLKIAKITPTKKDDKICKKILTFLVTISGLIALDSDKF